MQPSLFDVFGNHLTATVETIGGYVVTAMEFTGGGILRQGGRGKCIVGTTLTAA
jgi:hypothetical protein